jgi:signal transduction histidine kinase
VHRTKIVSPAEQKKKIKTTNNGTEQALRRAHDIVAGRAAAYVPSRPSRPSSPSRPSEPSDRPRSLQAAQAKIDALEQRLRDADEMARLGTRMFMVVHEFNNILTPIINYAQQAMSKPKFVPKALAHAVNGGERAKVICERLLDMTHGDGTRTDENVLELVQGALTGMGRDVGKDSIELTLDIPADLRARTGRAELQQVLVNLLMNARQALLGRGGGVRRIEIAARREPSAVTLSVSDSGPGVPTAFSICTSRPNPPTTPTTVAAGAWA